MRKLIYIALLLGVVLSPASSFALVGSRNLAPDVRARRLCIGEMAVRTGTIAATEGQNAVISAVTVNGASAPSDTVIATMQTPAKVMVQLVDSTGDDTLTCTSVVIVGRDMWGRAQTETVSTITETAQESANVYAVVESVTGAGCAGASDAADVLVLYESQEIGLGLDIDSYTDVESVCIVDSSDSNNVKCAYSNDATAYDLQSVVDATPNTIDLSVAIYGGSSKVAVADGDTVCFTVRP